MGRRAATAAVAVGSTVAACAAYAWWTHAGSGTGEAASGTPAALVLTPGVPVAALHPGGRSDVALTARNPGEATVALPALALDPAQGTDGFAVDAEHPGCPVTALRFHPPAGEGAWTVPGRRDGVDGTLQVTLPAALAMAEDAADACQGATVTVFLRAAP